MDLDQREKEILDRFEVAVSQTNQKDVEYEQRQVEVELLTGKNEKLQVFVYVYPVRSRNILTCRKTITCMALGTLKSLRKPNWMLFARCVRNLRTETPREFPFDCKNSFGLKIKQRKSKENSSFKLNFKLG